MDKPSTGGGLFGWMKNLFVNDSPAGDGVSFGTNLDRNDANMLAQQQQAQQYRSIILSASKQFNIPTSVICGIGSRESHWGLVLKPQGAAGTGDFGRRSPRGARSTPLPPDGGGFGRGLLQIDYDWHEFARTGNWRAPQANIFYGCQVLSQGRDFLQQRISLAPADLLQASIAAYNCGATATLGALQAGLDVDAKTTGADYSHDVLNRAGWFQLYGWA
jgi:hypothetical protein